VGRRARSEATDHSALDVVNKFFDAIEARDFERAQALLSADNFSYEGPIERFDNAAAFVQSLSRIGSILKGLKRWRMFIDGNEVCAILTYETTLEAIESTRIAHWVCVEHGRITRIESFFDARAYAEMFNPEP
jgi:ketosteroid isomerase-like protein